MNCDRIRPLIDPYSTEELDLAAALEVEGHLEICPACAGELQSLRTFRQSAGALRYTAPAALVAQVRSAFDQIDVPRTPAPARIRRYALAAAIAMLLLLPWLAVYWSRPSSSNALLAELTSSHIRSLMTDHLLDVPSSDQHTVKPWFNGKLDFSPTVTDLSTEGFPLIGGRLDYVQNRPVAALVYRRDKHIINLFMWPATIADSTPAVSHHNGYNLITWTTSGMSCAAVSDLNPTELDQFVHRLRAFPSSLPSR